ncbi:MAG: elongation factor G [Chitinivibrionales bacterium]|nr:elongation factor G [Chitinivibrionales bacterium]
MKVYDAKSIRNVCLVSHGGVGKTSLMEAMSHTAKATHKLGKVDNGTSIFDTRPDEKERKMTISAVLGFCEWKDTKINMIDTPGFLDLQGDAKAALRVVETALVLIDAVDGIQVGTEIMSRFIEDNNLPRFFVINGLDRENVDFNKIVNQLKENFGTSVAPLSIPIGSGPEFKGVVNLITRQAYEYTSEGNGAGKKIDIPADMSEKVDKMRSALMESIAESDESLMNSYFEKGELSDDEMKQGLAKGVANNFIYPLLSVCATGNMGADVLLDTIVNLSPSPEVRKEIELTDGQETSKTNCGPSEPTVAFVFKTISEEHVGELNIFRVFSGKAATGQDLANPRRGGAERPGALYIMKGKEKIEASEIGFGDIGGVLKLKDTHTNDTLVAKGSTMYYPPTEFPEPLVSIAISPKSKGDEEKIGVGLNKLQEEDATFTYEFHPDIHQSILSGMGDVHIQIILENLQRRFKVSVDREQPKISYRETITKPVKYVEYTHKKQTGGAGQYARVFIDLEPMERGAGYEFEDKIVGGVIDQPLRPSVDKGVRSKIVEGIIAGYPIVDIKVALVDGKTHPVDSKDIAFQIAGREVFKKAFEMASPILLEPIVDLEVTVPDDYTGDIMGDLSSRRGKISGMEPKGKYQTIHAKVPVSEIATYSQTMRSLTQGRGFYSKTFSHYEPVPPDLTKKIVEKTKQEAEQESA